ncbi:YaaC family protein [Salirhabdus sp. Marseille-P4669]|uniref:YaaC family protein n=1 Tax=Salirhabdus sp. Marseille-P4669 TaxID=2042310 RepID=UPI000C7A899B|nr:YaaC family protein [Salirhabdus sp. Marseille-P4669]
MNHNNIATFFDQLKSIPFVQNYLLNCYQQQKITDYDRLSYQNAEQFIYYIEHAEVYFEQSKLAPISIKPVLLFYGMNQLIKACLLTKRPHYPENTKLLAHGVSTRKRKKQSYRFLQDEIKIQQYGLFPYFSNHLFHIGQFPTDKFSMDSLLIRIPELRQLFSFQNRNVQIEVGSDVDVKMRVPLQLLIKWHMTEGRFIEKLKQSVPAIKTTYTKEPYLVIELEQPLKPFESNLITSHSHNNQYYLCTYKQAFFPLHEAMIHYLILYNLSMICRYETEWWGDLLHTYASDDYAYIVQFLKIAEYKTPMLLGSYLIKQWEANKDG